MRERNVVRPSLTLGMAGLFIAVLAGCSSQTSDSTEAGPYSGGDVVGTWVGTYSGFNADDEYVTWDVELEFNESEGVGFRGYRSFVDELLNPASTYVKGVITADGHVTMHESDSVFQGTLAGTTMSGTFLGAGETQSIFVVELTKE